MTEIDRALRDDSICKAKDLFAEKFNAGDERVKKILKEYVKIFERAELAQGRKKLWAQKVGDSRKKHDTCCSIL